MVIEDLTYLSAVGELRPPYSSPSALVRAKQIDRVDLGIRWRIGFRAYQVRWRLIIR